MRWLLLFSLLLCLKISFAQEIPVTIAVTTGKGEPVPAASVLVMLASDTNTRQSGLADSSGKLQFRLRPDELYILRASSVGFEPAEKNIRLRQGEAYFTINLQAAASSLGRVVITARKPLMRQEDDKTIVDPEPIAAASTNAYEIMEKTPGLFVDQDGNIYISSTTPARVFINGREQRMSAADIATILKNLPPTAISSIEILRMPSAKYDASGGGGVVNVILKKGVRIGLTGSFNLGMNQGRYGNQYAGLSINNNNGRLSSYINLNVSRRNSFEELQSARQFTSDSLLTQEALTKYPGSSYYIGYGLNYELGKKWEWSYDGRLSYGISKSRSENESEKLQSNTGNISNRSLAHINNDGRNFFLNQGMNFKYKIDSAGSAWTTDLSFSHAPNHTDQDFVTDLTLPVLASFYGDARIENRYRFGAAATDLAKKLSRKTTVEAGLKSSGSWFSNSNRYFNGQGSSRTPDAVRSGSYRYRENINAAYGQVSRNFGMVLLKAGVRMENTNMEGHQLLPRDTSFSIHRTDFFPYAYLSRNLMKIFGYDLRAYLVYRRTISRPAYEYLNPSQRYVDPYLVESGNPSLRPQFTQTYEANISVDERPVLAFGINDTKDIFNQVVYQADTNQSQAIRTYDNLGKNREMYFRALGALPPGGKYFFVLGAQYNHNFYQGSYEGKPLSFKRGSWRFFTYHSFKAGANTQVFFNGFLTLRGQLQFYEISTFGQLNAGVTQQFLNKKLTLNLFFQDILYSNRNEFVLNQGSVKASGERRYDTRRISLSIRYNFGLRKKEEQKMPEMEGG